MVESSLTIFRGGLTAVDETAGPIFSQKQQEELLKIGRLYIRKIGLPMSRSVLQSAGGVLGDALSRALAEKNQPLPDPKERLNPLVKRGLEIREDLRRKAETYLDLTLRNQTSHQQLVGPLALPLSLVLAAQTELSAFAIKGNIPATEQMAAIGQVRFGMIGEMAQISLAHLPDTFRAFTLDRIPKTADRAGMVRNSLISAIFRENLSPLITSADLKSFVGMSEQLILPDIVFAGFLAGSEAKKGFLSDLLEQAKMPFLSGVSAPADTDADGLVRFYRYFARDFLLSHPDLEELTIITNPDKVTADRRSLWDDAETAGTVKIPGVVMLAQAIRQAEAAGNQEELFRLKQGVKLWGWLKREQLKLAARIAKAEEELPGREQLWSNLLSDPNFPLPKEAYLIRYTVQRQARSDAFARQRERERLRGIVEEMLEEQKTVSEYESALNEQYGEDWPDNLPIPRYVFIKQLKEKRAELTGQYKSIQRLLSPVKDLLHLDPFWHRGEKILDNILQRSDNTRWFARELKQTRDLTEKEAQEEGKLQLDGAMHQDLLNHLSSYFKPKKAPPMSEPLKTYREFWHGIYDALKKGSSLRGLAPQIPPQRLEFIKFVLEALEQKGQILSQRRYTQKLLEELAFDPQQPLPQEAVWSKEAARSYIRASKASELTDFKGVTPEEMAESATDARYLINRLNLSDLPLYIPDKTQLEDWLNERLGKLTSDLEGIGKEFAPYQKHLANVKGAQRLTVRRNICRALLKSLDSPPTPLIPKEGLSREEFIKIWQRKADFIYALCYGWRIRHLSEETEQKYQDIMRITFLARLRGEIDGRRADLDQLRKQDLMEELVKRMRSLGLVPEENADQAS